MKALNVSLPSALRKKLVRGGALLSSMLIALSLIFSPVAAAVMFIARVVDLNRVSKFIAVSEIRTSSVVESALWVVIAFVAGASMPKAIAILLIVWRSVMFLAAVRKRWFM